MLLQVILKLGLSFSPEVVKHWRQPIQNFVVLGYLALLKAKSTHVECLLSTTCNAMHVDPNMSYRNTAPSYSHFSKVVKIIHRGTISN